MAGPLAAVPVQELIKQKLPEAAQQNQKAGQSKFDQGLKSQDAAQAKATGQVDQSHSTHAVQHASAVEKVKHAEQATKVQKTELSRLDPNKTRDASMLKNDVNKSNSYVSQLVGGIEQSGRGVDEVLKMAMSGKQFSNQEMLALQAGMYKYSQELDLTSKVVEKATSGLKDTLKTQV